MRNRWFLAALGSLIVSVPGRVALGGAIDFSGTVTYDGSYVADTLYVAVVAVSDTATTIGLQRLPAGTPPLSIPFSINFDNAGVTDPVLMAAVLDVDASGFDPDSLDGVVTNLDVLGWYDGQADPLFVAADSSRSGLDFALPTGEIHGDITFAMGQTIASISPATFPNDWELPGFVATSSGPYQYVGVYAGNYIIEGNWDFGRICFGDPTCSFPTVISLAAGEVRTGIDFDFSATPVESSSWSRVKALYRD